MPLTKLEDLTVQNKNIQKLDKNLFTGQSSIDKQINLSHNCILLQGNGMGINNK
jgi:hypothetical protein